MSYQEAKQQLKLIPKDMSYKMEELQMKLDEENNIYFEISRFGDSCQIKYLVLTFDKLYDERDIKHMLEETEISLSIGDVIYFTEKISFFIELNKIICNDTTEQNNVVHTSKIAIRIPDFIFDEIILLASQYCTIKIHLDTKNIHALVNASLLVKYTYYNDYDERAALARKMHSRIVQHSSCFETNNCQIENNIYVYNIDMNADICSTKGYFIEGNISQIQSIRLSTCGANVFELANQFMVKLCCNQISQNLLYMPLTQFLYDDNTIESYIGSICHNLYDSVKLKISTKSPINTIKVHALSLKYFNYMSGLACISNNPIDDETMRKHNNKVDNKIMKQKTKRENKTKLHNILIEQLTEKSKAENENNKEIKKILSELKHCCRECMEEEYQSIITKYDIQVGDLQIDYDNDDDDDCSNCDDSNDSDDEKIIKVNKICEI